jgi:hypothetical protein
VPENCNKIAAAAAAADDGSATAAVDAVGASDSAAAVDAVDAAPADDGSAAAAVAAETFAQCGIMASSQGDSMILNLRLDKLTFNWNVHAGNPTIVLRIVFFFMFS